jgi:hypothetical protein
MRFKHIFYNIVFLSIKLMFIKCFFNNFDILIFKIKKKNWFFFIYIFNKMEECYKSER